VSSPEGTIGYDYDSATGRLERTYTLNADTSERVSTAYGYDELGRLTTVTLEKREGVTNNEVTRYVYDDVGRIDYEIGPNNVTKDVIYDALGRVDQIDYFVDLNGSGSQNGTERLISRFDYAYDLAGNRTSAVEQFNTDNDAAFEIEQRFDWDYDGLNRLIEEKFDAGNNGTSDPDDYLDQFAFDRASNRVEKTRDTAANGSVDETTSYVYDQNDRLLVETKAGTVNTTTTYEYGVGNTSTQKTRKTVTGDVTETHVFAYDERGRLKSATVTKGSTVVSEYEYNDSGIRVRQTVDGTETIYLVDANNPTGYTQILEEGVDGNANGKLDQNSEVEKTFTLGLDVITEAQAAAVMHLLYDVHGSTRMLLDGAGNVVLDGSTPQVFTFDAYGNLVGFTGTPLTDLLYSGEITDSTTGQQYLRARYYDPASGRFNRVDPFAGNLGDPLSLNKYLYTHGNPVGGIDPSGLLSTIEVGVASSIAVSIDSLLITALIVGKIQQTINDTAASAQLQHVAQQLDTEVFRSVKDIKEPPNSRIFVHGSNAGQWLNTTGIAAIGSGDFGTGFYTFQNSTRGVTAAANLALSRARSSIRGGGLGFVLFVAIDANAFGSLSKRFFGFPNSPSPDWSPTVNSFYENGGRGFLRVDVAIGPYSRTVTTRGFGSELLVNPSFPNQYKFETSTAISQLKPIGIIPAYNLVGPRLA